MKYKVINIVMILTALGLSVVDVTNNLQRPKVVCYKDNCDCYYNGQYKYEYDKEWDGYTCGCNSDHKYWVAKPRNY